MSALMLLAASFLMNASAHPLFVCCCCTKAMSAQDLPLLPFDLNVDQCQAILVETLDLLPLLYTDRLSSVSRSNLKVLLDTYFQDDALGHCFRSMIVYGQVDGAEVTLDHFNKFVMRPQSSNMVNREYISQNNNRTNQ